jgi:hypothetical protein
MAPHPGHCDGNRGSIASFYNPARLATIAPGGHPCQHGQRRVPELRVRRLHERLRQAQVPGQGAQVCSNGNVHRPREFCFSCAGAASSLAPPLPGHNSPPPLRHASSPPRPTSSSTATIESGLASLLRSIFPSQLGFSSGFGSASPVASAGS